MADQPTITARIISPKRTIFEGAVYSISSQNSAGKFDILPGHANFITLIQNQPIVIKTASNQTLNLKLPISVIYTSNNLVTIYTDLHLELA